jgi:hypothetical protein
MAWALERSWRARVEAVIKGSDPRAYGHRVIFSGREPLASPLLFRMAALARASGYREVRVLTNGLLAADPAVLKRLIDAGVTDLRIPVYGSTAAVHDEVTRTPGSFERLVEAIMVLRAWPAAPALAMQSLFLRQNIADFPALAAFVQGRLGVPFLIRMPYPCSDDPAAYALYCPPPADVRKLLAHLELDSLVVNGVPLCLFPAAYRASRRDALTGPAPVEDVHAKGAVDFMGEQPLMRRVHPPACRQCAANACCPGMYHLQARLYGTGALRPLKRM